MKTLMPILTEIKQGRINVLRSVSLDELLVDTIASQHSQTNIIAGLIELILREYLFLKEIEMFSKVEPENPLTYPLHSQGKEFVSEYSVAMVRLEEEFRKRFCSNPPTGRIEWAKIAEFLDKNMQAA